MLVAWIALSVPCLDRLGRVEALAVPALQNLIHVRPIEAACIQAGPLIGHGDGLVVKAHLQPALGIALLCRGQISAPYLQGLHELGQPGSPDILGLDKGRGLLDGIDAPLRPGIGLLLDGPQAGIPGRAPLPRPLLAVADEHLDHLGGQKYV